MIQVTLLRYDSWRGTARGIEVTESWIRPGRPCSWADRSEPWHPGKRHWSFAARCGFRFEVGNRSPHRGHCSAMLTFVLSNLNVVERDEAICQQLHTAKVQLVVFNVWRNLFVSNDLGACWFLADRNVLFGTALCNWRGIPLEALTQRAPQQDKLIDDESEEAPTSEH
ncbi:MAG: hypothetical protein NXI04_25215 [Planctomycetaceae bacterium]|nr:hypothetical protein [Planctomycetaceae bacterium]